MSKKFLEPASNIFCASLSVEEVQRVGVSNTVSTLPEWVHLFPLGTIKARDGRRFQLDDAQAVIEASRDSNKDLVIDYEHQTDHAEKNGQKAPAAGWIKEFTIREDGIWARAEWTPDAAEHIRKKEYRYISPTFLHERHGQNRVVRILRAALTNNPALHLVALASLNANQELKKIQELNDKPSNLTKETASMIVNSAALITVFTGFKTLFNKAFEGAESTAMKIAMSVKSETKEENYAWLGQSSRMRQWAGDRVIRNLALHSYAVKNLKFEDTISISRDDIADDKIGVFSPVISDMGRNAKQHPDELLYGLLNAGFETVCYDGQYFFDAEHPVTDGEAAPVNASNLQSGDGPAWFLIDASRMIKPLIWQEREGYQFQSVTSDSDMHVFMTDEYIYGVRARVNAGFGLWQLAFGSKADLNAANYEAARASMASLKGENGRPLGVRPTHLVVPQVLEGPARRLINAGNRVEIVDVGEETQAVGTTNEWAGTAELIVTPYL